MIDLTDYIVGARIGVDISDPLLPKPATNVEIIHTKCGETKVFAGEGVTVDDLYVWASGHACSTE